MLDLLQKHGGHPTYHRATHPDDHRNTNEKAYYVEVNKTRHREYTNAIKADQNIVNKGFQDLIDSIKNNNVDKFQKAILLGEDVNQREGQTQRTPLHYACLYLRETLFMILLKQKAHLNAQDEHGHTALHIMATQEEQNDQVVKRMIEALMNFGANVNMPAFDGNTPIHLACANNNKNTVSYLVSNLVFLYCVNFYSVNTVQMFICSIQQDRNLLIWLQVLKLLNY